MSLLSPPTAPAWRSTRPTYRLPYWRCSRSSERCIAVRWPLADPLTVAACAAAQEASPSRHEMPSVAPSPAARDVRLAGLAAHLWVEIKCRACRSAMSRSDMLPPGGHHRATIAHSNVRYE